MQKKTNFFKMKNIKKNIQNVKGKKVKQIIKSKDTKLSSKKNIKKYQNVKKKS